MVIYYARYKNYTEFQIFINSNNKNSAEKLKNGRGTTIKRTYMVNVRLRKGLRSGADIEQDVIHQVTNALWIAKKDIDLAMEYNDI